MGTFDVRLLYSTPRAECAEKSLSLIDQCDNRMPAPGATMIHMTLIMRQVLALDMRTSSSNLLQNVHRKQAQQIRTYRWNGNKKKMGVVEHAKLLSERKQI